MNQVEQKVAAKNFVTRWQAAEGNEDREARSFWIELAGEVLGIQNPTHVLDFERRIKGRKCDVFFEDQRILVENKSRGVSLDEARHTDKYGEETPFQQALWYHRNLGSYVKPYWLITCNFDEMRIYDMRSETPDEDSYVSLRLEDLPGKVGMLKFFVDKSASRITAEKELSIKAAELVGKLYDELARQYEDIYNDPEEQRSLNIVLVRLVFLLYAEDAGLFEDNAFYDYMRSFGTLHSRQALVDLFKVLDTPYEERDKYLSADLAAFPYVNGGLFAEEGIIVPQLTEQFRVDLLVEASAGFNWSKISPTIFGAAFESTLSAKRRREGGMHYTSIENIHKVIDPLFLDSLKAELAEIEGEKVPKRRNMALQLFQRKLASIKIFDPACGSGNFLTESYICLRKLENRVLEHLNGDQAVLGFGSAANDTIMVNIGQLYGIEVDPFAVSVAKTALWIAESQAMDETQQIVYKVFDFLPLRSISGIVEGNALRMDWSDVCPAQPGVYLCGNPPFYGASNCSKEQKADVSELFGGKSLANSLDYVAGWYVKAARYMALCDSVRAAFVSTNSIMQGEQVAPIWGTLFGDYGIRIDFAWDTFYWSSEASDPAHVHCVIVGFSKGEQRGGTLYSADGAKPRHLDSFSPYRKDLPLVLIPTMGKPICDVPSLAYGNKPTDGGNLIMSDAEKDGLLAEYPQAEQFVRRFVGAQDYLNGKTRWCLWLLGADPALIESCPPVAERVRNVRDYRARSSAKDTRKRADAPNEFFRTPVYDVPYLAVPRTSSERRDYLPIGYFGPDTIASDATSVIPDASLYAFGVLSSQAHNAWMRTVCGRLESRYRYSGGIVYNSFIWPSPTGEQRADVEACAQAVLDAREAHPGKTLAELYDPDKMPADLKAAHNALDAAVERAYRVDFQGDEEKIVAHLFRLYAETTGGN